MEQSEKCRIGIVDLMSFFWTLAGARKKGEDAFGLALQVLRYMRDRLEKAHKLDAIAFCADGPGPSWRTAVDPAYKAHREEKPADRRAELEALMSAMNACGMPVLIEVESEPDPSTVKGILWFEGDDLCASVAAKAMENEDVPVVFSNDGDLAQLLALPGVELYSTRGEAITAERVFREWGVMPAKLGDLKALAGDGGDGYKPFPGGLVGAAKGIGEKGAVDLIKAFGSAQEAVRAALDDPTRAGRAPARLVQLLKAGGRAALDRGLKLALLRTDATVPDGIAEVTEEDWDAAEETLKERERGQREEARLADDPRKAVLRLVEQGKVAEAREIVERMIVAGEDVSGLTVLLPLVVRSIPREGDPDDHGGTPHDDNAADLLSQRADDLADRIEKGPPDPKLIEKVSEIASGARGRGSDGLDDYEPVILTAAEYWAIAPLFLAAKWLSLPSEADSLLALECALLDFRPTDGERAFFAPKVSHEARQGLILLADCASDIANGCTSASDPYWRKLLIAQIKRIPGALYNLRGYGAPLVRAGT